SKLYTLLTLIEEEYDKDETDLDQNNERKNMINNRWTLKGSQKLDNRDNTRIKQDVRAMLKYFFLYRNQRSEERISTKAMHDELLKYAEDGEIERKDVPKFQTIQNWLNSYAQAFKATEHELELAYK
ncbi:17485_t:CDS:2, partial [Racocetra persica]